MNGQFAEEKQWQKKKKGRKKLLGKMLISVTSNKGNSN